MADDTRSINCPVCGRAATLKRGSMEVLCANCNPRYAKEVESRQAGDVQPGASAQPRTPTPPTSRTANDPRVQTGG